MERKPAEGPLRIIMQETIYKGSGQHYISLI